MFGSNLFTFGLLGILILVAVVALSNLLGNIVEATSDSIWKDGGKLKAYQAIIAFRLSLALSVAALSAVEAIEYLSKGDVLCLVSFFTCFWAAVDLIIAFLSFKKKCREDRGLNEQTNA